MGISSQALARSFCDSNRICAFTPSDPPHSEHRNGRGFSFHCVCVHQPERRSPDRTGSSSQPSANIWYSNLRSWRHNRRECYSGLELRRDCLRFRPRKRERRVAISVSYTARKSAVSQPNQLTALTASATDSTAPSISFASVASAMTRINGSVPDLRMTKRPFLPSFFSASAIAA